MNKKAIIALGLAATTVFSGLVARQVIGSQAADQCRVAVDSYTTLAEDQIKDMETAHSLVDMIVENPFSALMVGGQLASIGAQSEGRWEDIDEAEGQYYDSCVQTGFLASIVDPYTDELRQEKWATEAQLESTRDALLEAGKPLGW